MDRVRSVQAQLTEIAGVYAGKAKVLASNVTTRSVAAAKDRKVQVTVASAAGGTMFLGFCGGAVGLAVGGTLGAAVGIPFALFTFGLSIPISATLGGGVGGATGAVVGGTAGCATGGTAGYTLFIWRNEIAEKLSNVWSKVKATTSTSKVYLGGKASAAYKLSRARLSAWKDFVTRKASAGTAATKQKASELASMSVRVAKDPQAQVAAASAAAGGAAFGAGGGAVGLATGGIAGAVVGVVPALFTFGLSIPIGAMIGGGAGLCVGTVVGGTTGVVGGGAVGYGVYGKRVEIRSGASGCATYVREKALVVRAFVDAKVNTIKGKAAEPQKASTIKGKVAEPQNMIKTRA